MIDSGPITGLRPRPAEDAGCMNTGGVHAAGSTGGVLSRDLLDALSRDLLGLMRIVTKPSLSSI
jgi:hypothetical protein